MRTQCQSCGVEPKAKRTEQIRFTTGGSYSDCRSTAGLLTCTKAPPPRSTAPTPVKAAEIPQGTLPYEHEEESTEEEDATSRLWSCVLFFHVSLLDVYFLVVSGVLCGFLHLCAGWLAFFRACHFSAVAMQPKPASKFLQSPGRLSHLCDVCRVNGRKNIELTRRGAGEAEVVHPQTAAARTALHAQVVQQGSAISNLRRVAQCCSDALAGTRKKLRVTDATSFVSAAPTSTSSVVGWGRSSRGGERFQAPNGLRVTAHKETMELAQWVPYVRHACCRAEVANHFRS